jgi:hypothetical protein
MLKNRLDLDPGPIQILTHPDLGSPKVTDSSGFGTIENNYLFLLSGGRDVIIFVPKFLCANSISGVKSCWTPGTFAAEPVSVGQLVGVAVQAELVKRHITQLHLEWRCENRRPTVLQENIFSSEETGEE